ncbi:MAG: VCBS domain-containing protein, partial [Alphaproteobacteria bacterium]
MATIHYNDEDKVLVEDGSIADSTYSGTIEFEETVRSFTAQQGTYGTIYFNHRTGVFEYALGGESNAALQSLQEGEVVTDTVTLTVTTITGATKVVTINVTISGTNDAPTLVVGDATITAGDPDDGVESTVTGTLIANDVDLPDDAELTFDVEGAEYGSLVVNDDGTYTYTLDETNADIVALKEGETIYETVIVTVTDDQGASTSKPILITITGRNDAPIVSATTNNVYEETAPEVSGLVLASDEDGDSLTYSLQGTGSYGTFTLDEATGKYTYVLDESLAAVKGLGDGEQLTDTVTV